MGIWIATCVIVLALVFMVFARIYIFPRNQPKTDLIISQLNRLSGGIASHERLPRGCMVPRGADKG